ncbi:hypothetical protein BCR43DRAFT_483747 [Syncephalastrum racemosum]|uniref:Transcription factor TFIIIC triple barrel domain-containing protein n=1 Tax=Syncephalastrum racemosum TaxID=13706 RepID=A0A1X2HVM9_SYNRA|nr:hypothetical protein BCR43DRAFT_483747 [Syncephalastrum racemosum]
MDPEDEYEEQYVILDVGEDLSASSLQELIDNGQDITIMGLETSEDVFIRVGQNLFRGQLDETITTNLLFEIHERKREPSGLAPLLTSMREAADETRKPRTTVSYFAKTDRVISCDQVFLRSKEVAEVQPQRAVQPSEEPVPNMAAVLDLREAFEEDEQ